MVRSSLLGSRGRALYPPQQQPQQHVVVNATPANNHNNSIFSRQSLMVLSAGIMFGYLMLPILLVQHLGFEDMPIQHHRIQPPRSAGRNRLLSTMGANAKDARRLTTAEPLKHAASAAAAAAAAKTLEEEETPPEPPQDEDGGGEEGEEVDTETTTTRTTASDNDQEEEEEEEEDNSNVETEKSSTTNANELATPVEEKSRDAKEERKQETDTQAMVVAPLLSEAEERLVAQRDILSRQSMPTPTTPYIMKTANLPDHQRMKILVTGGAGFVGSHLVDKLMMEGHEVIVVDNFFTGQKKNIAHWLHHPNFSLVVHDVTEHLQLEVDQIYHLACPASPPHYQYNPVKTIKTSTMGTLNMLGLAKRVRARILLTSTSEIYGDPKVHPQPESYWGNVNTVGPRSCYDEGKRVAETMMYSYRNQNKVEVRVARIFNTFGPRMHPNDGRVVSNFIIQALQNKNMTVYGEGKQTRSFQYVSDLVSGLHALMNGKYDMPVNLGNPDEYSVAEFAKYIQKMTDSTSQIVFLPKSQDDPSQRKPDITTAKREINWEPKVNVEDGLKTTIEYFSRVLDEAGEIIPTGPGAAKPEA